MKHLTEAAQRIKEAVDNKERIILYSDSDLDGTCSAVIMKEAISSIGEQVTEVCFPNREKNGHGLNETSLKELERHAPALLIVMDMGIGNVKEVEMANEMGFDVIIIDHHEVLEQGVPDALYIVNPKQEDDPYPFKTFAACGLVYKVARRMIGDDISRALRRSLIELAALGTIADMMPREEDNIDIIEEGVLAMQDTWRPGLQEALQHESLQEFDAFEDKVFRALSIMNVRDVQDGYPASYRVLISRDSSEARELLDVLVEKNQIKQETVSMIVEDVQDKIKSKLDEPMVFEGVEDVDYVLLGSAASQLVRVLNKPVFLYKVTEEGGIGSSRAPEGYDTVVAMTESADLLVEYGGHPQASGFRILKKNIQTFRKNLINHFTK